MADGENVTGDVIGMIGFDTISPKCTHRVAIVENESGPGCDMESRLGTAPMTPNVTGDVTGMIVDRVWHKIEHNVG